jgi:hypothetical protein
MNINAYKTWGFSQLDFLHPLLCHPSGQKISLRTLFSNASNLRKASAFVCEPRRIFGVVQRFDRHCSCHPQCEYVLVGRYCIAARPSALPVTCITFDAAPISTKIDQQYKLTMRMAVAMFVETLDNSKYMTRLITESRSFPLNISGKKPKIKDPRPMTCSQSWANKSQFHCYYQLTRTCSSARREAIYW